MERILVGLVAVFAFIGVTSAVNCTAKADGVYEAGCKSFAVCAAGSVSIVDCENQQVFNNNTKVCDDPANVPAPCGNLIDCTGKADGQYADLDNNCQSWYTCLEEKFLGHNFCSPGTVFDETQHTCNWKNAVPAPCGTLAG